MISMSDCQQRKTGGQGMGGPCGTGGGANAFGIEITHLSDRMPQCLTNRVQFKEDGIFFDFAHSISI